MGHITFFQFLRRCLLWDAERQIPEDEEGNSLLDTMENLDETLVPEKALEDEETRRMILDLVDGLPPRAAHVRAVLLL